MRVAPDPSVHRVIPAPHEPTAPDRDPAAADLDAAAARLHAWHAVARTPPPHDHPAVGSGPRTGGADELAARLRERRSARHVAAAYSAVHGHPLTAVDDSAPGCRRRWGLGLRAAAAAGAAVLLVAVGAAVVAFGGAGDVVSLGAGGAAASADPGTAAGPGRDGGSGAPAQIPGKTPAPATTESAQDAPGSGQAAAGTTLPGQAVGAAATGGGVAGAVVVHVVGEVRRPGLVSVPQDARVADAVQEAGGPTKDADTAGLNLARAVVDGEQIRVPAPGEDVPPPSTGGVGEPGAAEVVDLNAATADGLEALPGVGPVLAERIVAHRDEHGPFTSVDELAEISGIGPSVLEQVRDLARV